MTSMGFYDYFEDFFWCGKEKCLWWDPTSVFAAGTKFLAIWPRGIYRSSISLPKQLSLTLRDEFGSRLACPEVKLDAYSSVIYGHTQASYMVILKRQKK